MTLEELRDFCMSLKGVTEEFPFDDVTVVYKVKGRMFVLANIDDFSSVSLKCDPDDALAFREAFESVVPGYHLNKKHWNTVYIGGDVQDSLVFEWISDSRELAAAGLSKKLRSELGL